MAAKPLTELTQTTGGVGADNAELLDPGVMEAKDVETHPQQSVDDEEALKSLEEDEPIEQHTEVRTAALTVYKLGQVKVGRARHQAVMWTNRSVAYRDKDGKLVPADEAIGATFEVFREPSMPPIYKEQGEETMLVLGLGEPGTVPHFQGGHTDDIAAGKELPPVVPTDPENEPKTDAGTDPAQVRQDQPVTPDNDPAGQSLAKALAEEDKPAPAKSAKK